MAEKEPGDERPSLEMPSLGFGRKRKKSSAVPEPIEQSAASAPDAPAAAPEPTAAPEPEPAPTQRLDPVPPQPAAPPLFVDEAPATRPSPVAQAERDPADDPDTQDTQLEQEDAPTAGARKQPREFALPAIGGMAASILTGLLVGLLTVGLTWGSLRLCEVVRGTPSCGNPGFFLLLAIMVAMVLVGQLLLRAFTVPDPGSTSFLGMGIVAVVALVFLVDLLFLWWMVIVIPAVAMASYALAHWVTTSLGEPVDSNMHR